MPAGFCVHSESQLLPAPPAFQSGAPQVSALCGLLTHGIYLPLCLHFLGFLDRLLTLQQLEVTVVLRILSLHPAQLGDSGSY